MSEEKGDRVDEGPLDLEGLKDFSFGPDWTSDSGRKNTGRDPVRRGSGKPVRDRDRRDRGSGTRPTERKPRGQDRRPPRRGKRGFNKPEPFRPVTRIEFYPDDEPFELLTRSLRNTLRVYELFELSRIVLEKPDRFVFVVHPPSPEKDGSSSEGVVYQSVPDGLPFLSEEEAIQHVLSRHLERFVEIEETKVDPPSGSFPVIHRCGMTGKWLGPPNHHRYAPTLREHHQRELPSVPFEKFRSKIETLKDEGSREAWLESMTTARVYRLREKSGPSAGGEAAPVEDASLSADGEKPVETDSSSAETPGPDEGTEKPAFQSLEELRAFLLRERRDDLVKTLPFVRASGKLLEAFPECPLKHSVMELWQRQKRFPLETANNLRGKLRKARFHIFKRHKGINYVCAVKPRPRPPGARFSDSAQKLLDYLDDRGSVDVPTAMRDLHGSGSLEIPEPLRRAFAQDLRWLKSEGYVLEFAGGRLEVQAREKVESSPPEKEESPRDSVPASVESPEKE